MLKIKENNIIKIKSIYETAPNIALVKYWGKYDEDYILPLNTSIGLTLNT
jgi:diphosphomevalonate decarboxylase